MGKRNYGTFFLLVLCTLFHVTFIAAISVYFFVASVTVDDPPDYVRNSAATSWTPKYASRQGIERALDDVFGSAASIEAFMVGLCLVFVVCVTAAFLLGELFLFHCVLIARGMTTYDYIMVERQRVDPSLARSNSLVRSQSRQNSGRRSLGSSSLSSSSSGWTQMCICCDSSANRVVPSDASANRRSDAAKKRKVRINPCQLMRAEKSDTARGNTKGGGGASSSGNGVHKDPSSSLGGSGNPSAGGIQDPNRTMHTRNGDAANIQTKRAGGGSAGTNTSSTGSGNGNDERMLSTSRECATHRANLSSSSSRTLEMTRSQKLPPLNHSAMANGNVGSAAHDTNHTTHAGTASTDRRGNDGPPPPPPPPAISDDAQQQRAPREGSPPHRMPSCSPPSKSYEVADDGSDPMVVTPTMSPRKMSSPAPMLPSPLHWPAAAAASNNDDEIAENGHHHHGNGTEIDGIDGMLMMSRV